METKERRDQEGTQLGGGVENCTFSRMEGSHGQTCRPGVRQRKISPEGWGNLNAQLWGSGWLEDARESEKVLKQGSDLFGLGEVKNGLGSF